MQFSIAMPLIGANRTIFISRNRSILARHGTFRSFACLQMRRNERWVAGMAVITTP